jgi:hypothetical protein
MTDMPTPADALDRTGYRVVHEDRFDAPDLDRRTWLPFYLPHWSSREAAAARYRLSGGRLRLRIDADQAAWCPEFDGDLRVSSLQTAVFSGPVGSTVGQHRVSARAVVREAQRPTSLLTPMYGLVEMRAEATDDPSAMVALWMIGVEDRPERSAEICVAEIFGREADGGRALVGMGVHPFADPTITDDFSKVPLDLDVRAPHDYAAEWTADAVRFYVDETLVKTVHQSPAYPMQLMLGIYEFPDARDALDTREASGYPKEFVVHHVRVSQRGE